LDPEFLGYHDGSMVCSCLSFFEEAQRMFDWFKKKRMFDCAGSRSRSHHRHGSGYPSISTRREQSLNRTRMVRKNKLVPARAYKLRWRQRQIIFRGHFCDLIHFQWNQWIPKLR
jgi:hypothetical protein